MDASELTQCVQKMRLDVDALPDAHVRSVVGQVLNLVEQVVHQNDRLGVENQSLREEVLRLRELVRKLKGLPPDSGPTAGGVTPPPASEGDRSSEKERRAGERKKRPPRSDGRSFRDIHVDRTVLCPVDPGSLPSDAAFVGYDDVVVQDLIVKTDNVRYRCELWNSPSQGRLRGPLPSGVRGEFGSRLRALLVSLKYVAGTSLPRAQELVEHFGIVISSASVVNILHGAAAQLQAEREDLFRAGLAATPYQHIDDTSARVGGEFWHTHVIGSPLHASYFTRPHKDRLTVLDLLRGGPRTYRFDALTQRLLREFQVPRKWRQWTALPQDRDLSEPELQELLATWQPPPPAACLERLREAAALASYRARPGHVQTLVADDAKQFRHLTDELGLCWIHEGRHYKALWPVVPQHQQQLADFLKRYWDYYGELQQYRESPSATEAQRLLAAFDPLFGTPTGYTELDRRIAKTRSKKARLLTVLLHPETPLHNNPAELDERVAARRRDVSLHCRDAKGADEMDTFTSIVRTAKKLLVNGYEYLHDRISGALRMPSLASLIRARSPPCAPASPLPISPVPFHCLGTPPNGTLCTASV